MSRAAARGWAAALLLPLAACSAAAPEIPTELRGRWTTEEAGFEGRALELREASLTFVTGIEPATTHDVVGVEARGDDDPDYLIRYLVDGRSEMTLSLRLDSGALYLLNRPTVRWTRANE